MGLALRAVSQEARLPLASNLGGTFSSTERCDRIRPTHSLLACRLRKPDRSIDQHHPPRMGLKCEMEYTDLMGDPIFQARAAPETFRSKSASALAQLNTPKNQPQKKFEITLDSI